MAFLILLRFASVFQSRLLSRCCVGGGAITSRETTGLPSGPLVAGAAAGGAMGRQAQVIPLVILMAGSRCTSTSLSLQPASASPPKSTALSNTAVCTFFPNSTDRTSTHYETRNLAKSWPRPPNASILLGTVPIRRGEDNGPELGGRAGKLEGHIVVLQPGVLDTDHPAALFHTGFGVIQHECLPHMEFRLHLQQAAMRVHHLRFRLFLKLLPLHILSQNDHGHVQHDPLASP